MNRRPAPHEQWLVIHEALTILDIVTVIRRHVWDAVRGVPSEDLVAMAESDSHYELHVLVSEAVVKARDELYENARAELKAMPKRRPLTEDEAYDRQRDANPPEDTA